MDLVAYITQLFSNNNNTNLLIKDKVVVDQELKYKSFVEQYPMLDYKYLIPIDENDDEYDYETSQNILYTWWASLLKMFKKADDNYIETYQYDDKKVNGYYFRIYYTQLTVTQFKWVIHGVVKGVN